MYKLSFFQKYSILTFFIYKNFNTKNMAVLFKSHIIIPYNESHVNLKQHKKE